MATYGPSCADRETLGRLVDSGVEAFRIAASKYSSAEIVSIARSIRGLATASVPPVGVFVDLPGDKYRFVNDESIDLNTTEDYDLVLEREVADSQNFIPVRSRPDVAIGGKIVVGDGVGVLEVVRVSDHSWTVRALTEFTILKRQGFSVIGGRKHQTPTNTDVHLVRSIPLDLIDGVLLSFVESSDQVARASNLLRVPVIPKIETVKGVQSTGLIARESPTIMLGRGDLMIDCGPIVFQSMERAAIDSCRAVGGFTILGTDLLSSSSGRSVPHRSEVAYLSELCRDPSIGFMLSDETSVGIDPVASCQLLKQLVVEYRGLP